MSRHRSAALQWEFVVQEAGSAHPLVSVRGAGPLDHPPQRGEAIDVAAGARQVTRVTRRWRVDASGVVLVIEVQVSAGGAKRPRLRLSEIRARKRDR